MIYLIILGVLLLFDIISFCLYGADKTKAEKHSWRTPEAVLLWSAVPGGIGALIGMKVFHHKTKKWYFRFVAGIFALLQVGAIAFIIYYLCKNGLDLK